MPSTTSVNIHVRTQHVVCKTRVCKSMAARACAQRRVLAAVVSSLDAQFASFHSTVTQHGTTPTRPSIAGGGGGQMSGGNTRFTYFGESGWVEAIPTNYIYNCKNGILSPTDL